MTDFDDEFPEVRLARDAILDLPPPPPPAPEPVEPEGPSFDLDHELVHLLAERPQQFIRTSFTPLATDEDGAVAAKEWLRIMYERMVDDLAWILAERLPLPPRGWLD